MSPRAACRLEALGKDSAYDYVDGIADWKAAGLATECGGKSEPTVIEAMRTDAPTCRPDEPMGAVTSRVTRLGWDVCVVDDCDRLAIGRMRGSGFDVDSDRLVVDVMEPGPSTVRPDQPLKPLARRMHKRNAPNVIVTTPQGQLLGILLRDEADRILSRDPPQHP